MTAKWDWPIAFLEMAGGIVGVIGAIRYGGIFPQTPLALPLFVIFLGLYVLSFIAGLFLWRHHPIGVKLSLVVQILLIPVFTIASLLYKFVSGLQLGFAIYSSSGFAPGFRFLIFFGSTWQISTWARGEPFLLGVNIIAVLIILYLLGWRTMVSQEDLSGRDEV